MSRRGRGESGMSLALVLVLVVAFGLLVPVLAQLGTASGVQTHVITDQRLDQLAAENAVQAAIARASRERTLGRDNVDCPDLAMPAADNNARDVTVRCRGFAASGALQAGPNTPAYALLATGTGDTETGIVLEGNGTVRTDGPLWSNSSPRAITLRDGARLDARADLVGGVGDCPGVAETDASPWLCGSGVPVPDPAAGNPAWATSVQAAADVPTRTVPADPCPAVPASRVYTLTPGTYRDLPGLNRLARGECGPVVLWLRPGPGDTLGRFFFDFDFFDPARTTWQVTDAVVVGGAPDGWDPAAATSQVDAVRARLAARDSTCNPGRHGVELVFGGASRIDLRAPGAIELCPIRRTTTEVGQALALTAGRVDTTEARRVAASPATTTATVEGGELAWPASIDPGTLDDEDCGAGVCAPGTALGGELRGRGARGVATLTVPYPVPEGVRIDELRIEVVHRERGDLADLRLEVDGLPASVTCEPAPVELDGAWALHSSTCTAALALAAAAPGTVALRLVATNEDVDGATSGIELDRVQVVADVTTPGLRQQSGCVVDPAADDCPFVDVRDGATFAVHGTVHAPQARIVADLGGRDGFRLTRGAVLRSFAGRNLPAGTFTPFSLPVPPYADRFVAFEALLDGQVALAARVYFCEALGPGGSWDDRCRAQPPRAPRITTWTVER